MHDPGVIWTLTGGLTAALIFGTLARSIGLSPLVGYLLAGIMVGPHTPGFVANEALASQFADIGVILLMFGVGLHFQLKDLRRVATVAIPGALIQIFISTLIGYLLASAFGWNLKAGLIFGLAISVASTVVLTRVLSENRSLHSPEGHIAIGWLVVQDIFTILILVMLPLFFGPHHASPFSLDGLLAFALVILKLAALFLLAFLFGTKAITALLGFASRLKSRELFTLTVLVMALGIAVGSSLLFGASIALGALIAGMIVGQSDYATRAASEALPMRDAFAVLFFVSMGMLFDPSRILVDAPMVASVLGLVVLGTPLISFALILIFRRSLSAAISIGAALSQIGEFSFILAGLALELKILPPDAMNILVAVAIISISLNPLLYRLARGAATRLDARRQSRALANESQVIQQFGSKMVLVGFGPVGRTLYRILVDNGFQVTVIEMNLETVKKLRESGISVVYGDSLQVETLVAAGIEDAQGLIVSTPDPAGSQLITTARELNSSLRILCRSNYLQDMAKIKQAGADAVFSGEGETALAMSSFLMRQLGSTDEQIDRERERVRKQLLDGDGS